MLYYLVGLVAICGLCGYCAFGRGDRWWAPKADGASFETTTDPARFQRLYDRLVEARKNNEVDYLVSKIDSSVFEIWTREQCTESVRRDLAATFPEAKIITVHGPATYRYTIEDSAGDHQTTVDPFYEADLELTSGAPDSVEFGEDDGDPTWFTPC